MKKFILLFFLASFMASCHTENFDYVPASRVEDKFETVSEEEAIGEMYSLMEASYTGAKTRALARRTVAGISPFKINGASTRSGETVSSRQLAYVVNFVEGGFAVLGAHRSIPQVLCITEEGLFEPDEVEELARELASQTSSGAIPELIGSPDPIRFIKKELLAYVMAADEEAALDNSSDEPSQWARQNVRAAATAAGTWSDWTDFTQSGPLLSTLWNQSYPYNKDCPPDPQDPTQTSYTGCVATALLQIIAHNAKPTPSKIDQAAVSTWTNLTAHYYNPSKTAVRTKAALQLENDLAAIVHDIGIGVDMDYSYFYGSAASSGKAEGFLKKGKIGYKNVNRKIWYNSAYITDMLEKGLPVYISAAGDGGAHAWVIDGSVHQKRTRTMSDGTIYIERRFMLHCNFGWGGTANGYYYSKTFTPNDGPVATEPGQDATNPGSNGRNYNRQYQIIQYEL